MMEESLNPDKRRVFFPATQREIIHKVTRVARDMFLRFFVCFRQRHFFFICVYFSYGEHSCYHVTLGYVCSWEKINV